MSLQDHAAASSKTRYNGRCIELQSQRAQLLQAKMYSRARATSHELYKLKAQQDAQGAAHSRQALQSARAHMARRHKRERQVLLQKQEDAEFKLLKAQQQALELCVRQRHAAMTKLARAQRRSVTDLQVMYHVTLCAPFTRRLCTSALQVMGDARHSM